jgi:DNA-binding NarL/FixJ family response regulator
MDVIRVLLADDQQMIREGIGTILRYTPGMDVVGQAANGREAVALARELRPDVVLMDLKMPVLGGIPAIREIVRLLPETHVIILTTYVDNDLVFDGIRAGAQGYLLKDASSERLVEAIRGVMRRESQVDPKVAAKVLAEFQRLAKGQEEEMAPTPGAPEPQFERLTPREEDVLRLLVEGLANKEIAARLSLTEGTIKNLVSAVIAKLQANDRTHAVVLALRRGLVDL